MPDKKISVPLEFGAASLKGNARRANVPTTDVVADSVVRNQQELGGMRDMAEQSVAQKGALPDSAIYESDIYKPNQRQLQSTTGDIVNKVASLKGDENMGSYQGGYFVTGDKDIDKNVRIATRAQNQLIQMGKNPANSAEGRALINKVNADMESKGYNYTLSYMDVGGTLKPVLKDKDTGQEITFEDYPSIDEFEQDIEEEFPDPENNDPTKKVKTNTPVNGEPNPEIVTEPLPDWLKQMLFQYKRSPAPVKNWRNALDNSGAGFSTGVGDVIANLNYGLDPLSRYKAINQLNLGQRQLTTEESRLNKLAQLKAEAPYYSADAQRDVATAYANSALQRAAIIAEAQKYQADQNLRGIDLRGQYSITPKRYETVKSVSVNSPNQGGKKETKNKDETGDNLNKSFTL